MYPDPSVEMAADIFGTTMNAVITPSGIPLADISSVLILMQIFIDASLGY
jgi:hypothetical protein